MTLRIFSAMHVDVITYALSIDLTHYNLAKINL
jgi:hypothetical protein